jgi:hypothetical protein
MQFLPLHWLDYSFYTIPDFVPCLFYIGLYNNWIRVLIYDLTTLVSWYVLPYDYIIQRFCVKQLLEINLFLFRWYNIVKNIRIEKNFSDSSAILLEELNLLQHTLTGKETWVFQYDRKK